MTITRYQCHSWLKIYYFPWNFVCPLRGYGTHQTTLVTYHWCHSNRNGKFNELWLSDKPLLVKLTKAVLNSAWNAFLFFHIIIHSQYREHQEEYLEDNCIVFENFTASIGDLMVANWLYWRRDSGGSKRIFATIETGDATGNGEGIANSDTRKWRIFHSIYLSFF